MASIEDRLDRVENVVKQIAYSGRVVSPDDARAILEPEEGSAEDRPPESALKAEWYEYREAQGYTDEELDTLTKDDLIELDDK